MCPSMNQILELHQETPEFGVDLPLSLPLCPLSLLGQPLHACLKGCRNRTLSNANANANVKMLFGSNYEFCPMGTPKCPWSSGRGRGKNALENITVLKSPELIFMVSSWSDWFKNVCSTHITNKKINF